MKRPVSGTERSSIIVHTCVLARASAKRLDAMCMYVRLNCVNMHSTLPKKMRGYLHE